MERYRDIEKGREVVDRKELTQRQGEGDPQAQRHTETILNDRDTETLRNK